MLKRNTGRWFVTVCYLGLCGGLGAIPFVGALAHPVLVDEGSHWPLMHASVVEFMLQPVKEAGLKE
jgi:hypothetical protein